MSFDNDIRLSGNDKSLGSKYFYCKGDNFAFPTCSGTNNVIKISDSFKENLRKNVLEKEHADKQVIVEVLRRLKSKKNIDENDVAQLTSHLMEQNKSHDRGWYRINAIRNMTGSQSLQTPMNKRTNEKEKSYH
ncbi:hypothetical protein KUTeg_002852 [Tegillarca granosa]|uniref:Sodium/calcium exchanger domain-containing protein n=1 Tax=Tegillarca granosa TaxID=220873 RepID=A0ABQ9FQN7_TEGGR|nr:hypothetical protein KUTeg_002852 [Tegillarca granosa]